jgi:hypothetical protein
MRAGRLCTRVLKLRSSSPARRPEFLRLSEFTLHSTGLNIELECRINNPRRRGLRLSSGPALAQEHAGFETSPFEAVNKKYARPSKDLCGRYSVAAPCLITAPSAEEGCQKDRPYGSFFLSQLLPLGYNSEGSCTNPEGLRHMAQGCCTQLPWVRRRLISKPEGVAKHGLGLPYQATPR